MNRSSISIIGLGQVGTALLSVLSSNGYQIISAFNRSRIPQNLYKKFPKTDFKTGLPNKSTELGELVFITVSDDAISHISEHIAALHSPLQGKKVVHCSGTHSSAILAPLREQGALVASFHPMKAITKNAASFEGIWFDVEGDEVVVAELETVAEAIEANTFRVEPEAKPYLHASAVVASNYMVVLADLVSRISALGEVPEEVILQAISPLMENTLQNIRELGVTEALTGPIARGDVDTIRQHLKSLKKSGDLEKLYKILGREAVDISERKNGSMQSLKEIKNLLL